MAGVVMERYNPTTVKDLCKPVGRQGFAYTFPIEVAGPVDPDDLRPLIDQKVSIYVKGGESVSMKVTDVSSKAIYGKKMEGGIALYETNDQVSVDLADLRGIEWTERVCKRFLIRNERVTS